MLHRDYLLEIIAQFVEVIMEALNLAFKQEDPAAIDEAEAAIAGLLDLDPQVALRLSPDSLVTMMILSGMGDSLADYVTYSLRQVGDAYERLGDSYTAGLRREQAHAVADSFGCDYDVVPLEFEEFNKTRE